MPFQVSIVYIMCCDIYLFIFFIRNEEDILIEEKIQEKEEIQEKEKKPREANVVTFA